MMPLQRTRGAESRVRNKLSNGPLRAQSNGGVPKVFCDVVGSRHLPGICWYPAKCTGHTVNQGGTADKCFYSSLTECISLSRTFLFYKTPLIEIKIKGVFSLFQEVAICCIQKVGGAPSADY